MTNVPSILFTLATLAANCNAFTCNPSSLQQSLWRSFSLAASSDSNQVDVSDLGLTMDDLEAPLPPELLQGIASSGYESTSRIPTVQDDGCKWTETDEALEVTLSIPGLRGQPAACLAVVFSTTSATITAFGRPVWSCILKGTVDPDTATFAAEDGPEMIPMVQLSVQKADASNRWGGFIEQIGEDSIL